MKALRPLIAPLMVMSVMLPVSPVNAVKQETLKVVKVVKQKNITCVKGFHKKGKKCVRNITPHPRQLAERASRSLWGSTRQWKCLEYIWEHESHFNPKARNKKSGAYGIAQFMPQTWGSRKKTSDPNLQIKYGLKYIKQRYGNPCRAMFFRMKHGYY